MKKIFLVNQIHQFCMNGRFYIFVVDNLRIYETDEENYLYIKDLFTDKEKLELDGDFIDDWVEAEIIKPFEEDAPLPDDSTENQAVQAQEQDQRDNPPVTNIVLELANDCNLNCIYCYGSGGAYGRKRELMSAETAIKAVDFMVENSGNVKELLIIFFGGEPLLNFSVMKEVVRHCKEIEKKTDKTFKYNMTTNGTILDDEIYDFLKSNKVSTMLSIDGPEQIQDTYRCYTDGCGSFDKILPNIEKFKEINGGYLSARATICKPNTDLRNILKSLLSMGFTKAHMSLVDTDKDSPLFVGNMSENLRERYLEVADDYIEDIKTTGSSRYRYFESYLSALYFKKLKIRACNAGTNGFAVGTDKKLYPCHRYMGMEDYVSGNLDSGIDRKKSDIFWAGVVSEKEGCKTCWARFLCGGACSNICVSQGNDVNKAPECYCDTYRDTIEIALYIYTQIKEWNNDFFKQHFEKVETATTIK